MIAHKFCRRGALGPLTQRAWPRPLPAADGDWLQVEDGPLVPCRNGLHACRIEQLSYWIADELWEVELGDEWIETRHSIVARRARLVRRIEAWEGAAAGAFTRACLARAEAAFARAGQVGTLASEYLESTQQFARDDKPALTAYAAAILCSVLATGQASLADFDSERRAQGLLLAAAVGL